MRGNANCFCSEEKCSKSQDAGKAREELREWGRKVEDDSLTKIFLEGKV